MAQTLSLLKHNYIVNFLTGQATKPFYLQQCIPKVRVYVNRSLEETIQSKIGRVIKKVNLCGVPALLQYWECSPVPGSDENECNVTVRGQPSLLTQGHIELERYRVSCLELGHCVVGQKTEVKNWLAGRAVQTRVADHGTKRDHLSDHTFGLLVVPVFFQQLTHKVTAGITELVTIEPKESYDNDVVHIHNLLKDEGLISEDLGKTIKIEYGAHIIKFPLSCSAKLKDLQKEVTKRFKELKNKVFSIEYADTTKKTPFSDVVSDICSDIFPASDKLSDVP